MVGGLARRDSMEDGCVPREAGEAEARGAWLVAEVKRVGGEERGGEGSTTAEEGRGGIGGCIGRA